MVSARKIRNGKPQKIEGIKTGMREKGIDPYDKLINSNH